MTEQDLLELKKQVDEAKTKVSELTGHKTALLKQLKNDWECNSVEDVEKKLKLMNKEIEKISQQIETGIEELESKYELK
jgi:predicted nuclease with TOPRIM domain